MAIKIGDVERLLPHGMFLHKQYQRLRYQSIVKLTETNSYIQRKNQVIEQAELIREEKKNLQTRLMMEKTALNRQKRTTGLSVPKYIQSSKHIMAEKKIAQAGMETGEKGGKKK